MNVNSLERKILNFINEFEDEIMEMNDVIFSNDYTKSLLDLTFARLNHIIRAKSSEIVGNNLDKALKSEKKVAMAKELFKSQKQG